MKWTKKGKLKDGYYAKGHCPRCGKTEVVRIGTVFACPNCNSHNGVKLTEKPPKK